MAQPAPIQPPKLPAVPPSLKSIQHFLKTAAEYDQRDPIVGYWSRFYAVQSALKLDKSSKEALAVILPLMDWLESAKKALKGDESVTNDIVGQAHVENVAWNVFSWADSQDRASVFNKNVVKAFYTAGVLYDVLTTFGELTEENAQLRKYAKWKAAYVHNCLKNGETPVPGPPSGEDFDEDFASLPPAGQRPQPPSSSGAQFGAGNFGEFGQNQFPSGGGGVGGPPAGGGGGGYDFLTGDPTPGMFQQPPQARAPSAAPASAPFQPSPAPAAATSSNMTPGGVPLSFDDMTKAQKYCKYATSALNYEDVGTAITNLKKALTLLETGQDVG